MSEVNAMNDYVRLVFKNMQNRRLRSLLTILGIVLGVAAIVALITVSSGFKFAVEHQFTQMGISNIRIIPANLRGPPAGSIGVSTGISDRVKRLKSVDYVNPVLMNFMPVEYSNEEKFSWVVGYDTSLSDKGFVDVDINLGEGRMFHTGERYSAIIGADVAREAFDKEVHLKNSIDIGDTTFKVVGIFEETGVNVDRRIFIPLESARDIFNEPEIINILVVKLKPGISMEEGSGEIKRELSSEIEDEEIDVFTPEQLLQQFTQILDVVQFVLVAIAGISLIVGAVGIMNSMFTSVVERTREIGVMKAIGARNKHVLLLFLIEAGILGSIGGALGLALGSGIALLINILAAFAGFSWLKFKIQLGVVVFSLLFSFIIGAIAGLVPAMRAAKLNPVDALRYE